MRWYRGLCTDLLEFALQLRKTSARRPSMRTVRPVITSNWVPYFQMSSVGSHSTSGMEKEGKKKRTVLLTIISLENINYWHMQMYIWDRANVMNFTQISCKTICLFLFVFQNTKLYFAFTAGVVYNSVVRGWWSLSLVKLVSTPEDAYTDGGETSSRNEFNHKL